MRGAREARSHDSRHERLRASRTSTEAGVPEGSTGKLRSCDARLWLRGQLNLKLVEHGLYSEASPASPESTWVQAWILHSVPFEVLSLATRLCSNVVRAVPERTRAAYATQRRAWPGGPSRIPLLASPTPSAALLENAPRLPRSAREARAVAGRLPGRCSSDPKTSSATSSIPLLRMFQCCISHPRLDRHRGFAPLPPCSSRQRSATRLRIPVRQRGWQTQSAGSPSCNSCRPRFRPRTLRAGRGSGELEPGFLGAGAASCISSLWKVSDEATERLMADFYGRLAVGDSKDASLRKAKPNTVRSGAGRYYWAAFVLAGDSHAPLPPMIRWWQTCPWLGLC